jgi:hypothetical protein
MEASKTVILLLYLKNHCSLDLDYRNDDVFSKYMSSNVQAFAQDPSMFSLSLSASAVLD